MRKRLSRGLAAPLAAVLISVGCSGDDGADRQTQHGMDNVPERQQSEMPEGGPAATVELTGCITGAPGGGQYALRYVRFRSGTGTNPHRDTTTPGPHGITEGSWVRLDPGDQAEQVRQLAGQQVTVVGTIVDSGRNTIGTAGSYGAPREGGMPSQAASPDSHWSEDVRQERGRIARESMADGTAAMVRVTEVEGTGDQCPADLVPSVR